NLGRHRLPHRARTRPHKGETRTQGCTPALRTKGRIVTAIEERREQVARMTRNGLSARQTAGALGVAERTVVRDRRATGTAKPPRTALTPRQLEIAAQLLDDGCSYAEVARTVGASATTIAAHFPGKGWTPIQAGAWGIY